jgi:hypothetical protein
MTGDQPDYTGEGKPQRRRELLALLEDGPKQTGQLADWLRVGSQTIRNYLLELERERLVRRIGPVAFTRWALAGYVEQPKDAGAPRATRRMRADRDRVRVPGRDRVVVDEPAEPDAGELDTLLDDDLDAEDVDAVDDPVVVPQLRDRGRPAKPVLRHPHERPSSVPLPKGGSPSWWVSAPRDGFSDQARAHAERMRSSKEHFQVKLRVLE